MSIELSFHNREFEYDVRELLNKKDGPITSDDVLAITKLDLSNFDLYDEDAELLPYFENVTELAVETSVSNLQYIKGLTKLNDLYVVTFGWKYIDFKVFENLTALESLCVSGGDISSIDFINVDVLKRLPNLKDLTLHEFGTVDLSFLEGMQHLESFYCGYANKVISAGSISKLVNLSDLTLIDFEVDNLDFLRPLNKSIRLELCGMRIQDEVDDSIIKAFSDRDVTENEVQGNWTSRNERD